MNWGNLSGLTKAAAICAVGGFFVTIHQYKYGPGYCSYIDYGAVALGALAVLLGAVTAIASARNEAKDNLIVGGIAALIGVYHIVTGLGIVGGPCD